jgi:hypothetical protein
MTPIEKTARAMKSHNYKALYDGNRWQYWVELDGRLIEEFESGASAHDRCDKLNARAAVEALRPFIHECVGVTSTSEYPIDKAVDAKIDAMLDETP